MKLKRYLLPAAVAALLLGGLFLVDLLWPGIRGKKTSTDDAKMELATLPHGRVLYVVVESDGYFLGQEFVPFIYLRQYLDEHARELNPDYVLVCGTASSRFGRAVEAIDSLRAVFSVPVSMETRTLPDGTRRGPIEIVDGGRAI